MAAGPATLQFADSAARLQEVKVLERHEVLRSGRKVDRDWWPSTKLGLVIAGALVAACAVHPALL